MKFNDIDDDATTWLYILKYICILYDDFMRCHEDTEMLCSTTSPYGRPMIDVAYGEMILSLH